MHTIVCITPDPMLPPKTIFNRLFFQEHGAPRRKRRRAIKIYPAPLFSHMTSSQTSFWSPARIGAVIGAILLIVALAYLVSLPQNKFEDSDLLEPKYAADADLGYWMVNKYDQEVDVYHLLVVMQHPNGTFEWLEGDGIWLPRRAVEGTFDVIGSFDRRKAHL